MLLAAVLLVVGNVLPGVRPNHVVGIRTPWSLRSELTWVRTHRIGGYAVVAFGAAILVFKVISPVWLGRVIAAGTAFVVVVVVVLSYCIWRDQRGTTSSPGRPGLSRHA